MAAANVSCPAPSRQIDERDPAATAQEEVVSLTGTAWHEWWRRACALIREADFDAHQRIVLLLNVPEVGTAKITDVRIDQLLPCQGSRTSLRRSHRSRKQNQPGFRRLRS